MIALVACAIFSIANGQQYEIPLPVYGVPVPTVMLKQVPAKTYGAPLIEEVEVLSSGLDSPISLPENTKVNIRDESGQYSHGFNAGGTQVSEQGSLITTNGGWEYVIAKKGSYSYTSPEGEKITVHYVADHNGFRIVDDPNSV